MPGITVEDGTGTGRTVAVDTTNRILTRSVIQDAEEAAAIEGEAYTIRGTCHTAAASSGAFLAFTNLSSNYDHIVTEITVAAQTLTPTNLLVNTIKEPTTSGGSDVSTTNSVNIKFDSGIALEDQVLISDANADLTYTNGTKISQRPLDSRSIVTFEIPSTAIVTPNTTFLVGWETEDGTNATDGEKVDVSLTIYRNARS